MCVTHVHIILHNCHKQHSTEMSFPLILQASQSPFLKMLCTGQRPGRINWKKRHVETELDSFALHIPCTVLT